jgi:hypothetical protein
MAMDSGSGSGSGAPCYYTAEVVRIRIPRTTRIRAYCTDVPDCCPVDGSGSGGSGSGDSGSSGSGSGVPPANDPPVWWLEQFGGQWCNNPFATLLMSNIGCCALAVAAAGGFPTTDPPPVPCSDIAIGQLRTFWEAWSAGQPGGGGGGGGGVDGSALPTVRKARIRFPRGTTVTPRRCVEICESDLCAVCVEA